MARREKIERLAKESPNAGERAAARHALARIPQPVRGTAEWAARETAERKRAQAMVAYLSVNRSDSRLTTEEQKAIRRLVYFNATDDKNGTIERLARKVGWCEHVA